MPTLLLIDDEPVIQHAFRKAFHPPEYVTVTARTATTISPGPGSGSGTSS